MVQIKIDMINPAYTSKTTTPFLGLIADVIVDDDENSVVVELNIKSAILI